ncbi:MAG: hypothetical protein WBW33_25805, partial [Bryobacteraceae bacterium]
WAPGTSRETGSGKRGQRPGQRPLALRVPWNFQWQAADDYPSKEAEAYAVFASFWDYRGR